MKNSGGLELPISIEDFNSIRNGSYYYVDKTSFIEKLTMSEVTGKKKLGYYFLSRPRRFGKSMIVDTLHCLYEGRKELFEGLHIYDRWDWSEKHPVIRLSFGKGEHHSRSDIDDDVKNQLFEVKRKYKSLFIFSYLLDLFFREISNRHDDIRKKSLRNSNNRSDITSTRAANSLSRLISALRKKTGKKVVVLIDEYDMPILDVLHTPQIARDHTSYLRGLYGTIKVHQGDIQFAFITGISMFSKVNLFSKINNFDDISLDSEYSKICGYSEEELKSVFAPELVSYDLEKIRRWYDGYCWDPADSSARVFCPLSVLQLFSKKRFDGWWYHQCIPKYLYDLLRKRKVTLIKLADREVPSSLLKSFNIERPDIETLLFQNGYLTIRSAGHGAGGLRYRLTFPNLEVAENLSSEYLNHLIGGPLPSDLASSGQKLLRALADVNGINLEESIRSVLAGISYHTFKNLKFAEYEACYGALLYALFAPLRPEVMMEEATARGRSDLVIKYRDKVFVVELKCIDSQKVSLGDQVVQALEQINRCGYGDKYQLAGVSCYAVAMIFGKEERNLLKVQIQDLA